MKLLTILTKHTRCLIRQSTLKPKLHSLIEDGFCIVIISNQKKIDHKQDYENGLERKVDSKNFQRCLVSNLTLQISSIQSLLGCPLLFFACYGSDMNRKPAPGVENCAWSVMCRGK
eukprot:763639-Hanusia_phi.AAC.3